MLTSSALRFANHVLAGEHWARTRLQAFGGQIALLEFGHIHFSVAITDTGLLAMAKPDASASVTITLPNDAPLLVFIDRSGLRAGAHIAGSADLAETLGFVFRNLRWDAEDDLSRLIGDVAARRLLQSGKQFATWHFQRAKNLALNVVEYLTEENPTVVRRTNVACFCNTVDAVRDDCARLEKRICKLESR